MVSPSVTETTLAGQERQVAGIESRRKRRMRWEQRMRVSLDEWQFLVVYRIETKKSTPGKITYSFVINKKYHWVGLAT
jgi:aminoglycoside phosphotransferase (APT) family kinase protein